MEETNQFVIEEVKSPAIPRRQLPDARLINETKSPSLQRRHLEHVIEVENKEIDRTWKSCCGLVVHSEPIQYFTTIIIISGIMIFCILKLNTNESCESQTAYMGLLTLLLGLVAPSPVFKKNK